MPLSDPQNVETLRRVSEGDPEAFATLFMAHRDRLRRLIVFRLDPRLRRRVGADDIVQEVYLDASKRLKHLDPELSPFVWLRMIATQTLANLHQRHLGTKMRNASREVSLHGSPMATSVAIADRLLGNMTSPSQAALRLELADQLNSALSEMSETDQDILAMRHFEDLSNHEIAEVLGIQPNTASIRYVRAVKRLKVILDRVPGFGGTP